MLKIHVALRVIFQIWSFQSMQPELSSILIFPLKLIHSIPLSNLKVIRTTKFNN
jgi:hypothetical protein